jgi:hypothetical protein
MTGLSFGFSQRLEQKLSLKQKHFGDFVSIATGICTNCVYELSPEEILAGFSSNPLDFFTTCPKCGQKFLSHLIITEKSTGEEKETEPVIFMCEAQTLHAMREIKNKRGRIGIAYLAKNNRQLFYNMVRYWATYELAMEQFKK